MRLLCYRQERLCDPFEYTVAHPAVHRALPARLPCPPYLEPGQPLQVSHVPAHPPYASPALMGNTKHYWQPPVMR